MEDQVRPTLRTRMFECFVYFHVLLFHSDFFLVVFSFIYLLFRLGVLELFLESLGGRQGILAVILGFSVMSLWVCGLVLVPP